MVARSRDWPDLPVSTVSQDNVEATTIAMDHLFGLGHRKIGFVASTRDQKFNWFAPRLRAYRAAMTDHGEVEDDTLYYSKIVVRGSLIERETCGRPRSL